MTKYYQIKWRDSDIKELKRVVRNFNAKIKRLADVNPNIANILPEKVKVRELKDLIATRRDLQRELNTLKRFSKRGAEEIVTISDNEYDLKVTDWQYKEMNRRVAIINRRRANRLERLSQIEAKEGGQPLGYKKIDIGMGSLNENELRPLKSFTRSMNRRDLQEKWKFFDQAVQSDYYTKKDIALRENYIKALQQNFKESDIADVVQEIRSLNLDEFLDRFEDFELAYPPDEEHYDKYLNKIRATWLPNKMK